MNSASKIITPNTIAVKLTPQQMASFWSKVKKTESCWIWMGAKRGNRYGSFKAGRLNLAAHRISFLINGGILTPEKPFVLHNCPNGDNGFCVNPEHLWAGNQFDNMRDMESKGRSDHPSGDRNGMVKHPESRLRGSQKPTSKLNEAQVLIIKKELSLKSRRTLCEIASDYGVTFALIGHIKHGRSWKHVKV